MVNEEDPRGKRMENRYFGNVTEQILGETVSLRVLAEAVHFQSIDILQQFHQFVLWSLPLEIWKEEILLLYQSSTAGPI